MQRPTSHSVRPSKIVKHIARHGVLSAVRITGRERRESGVVVVRLQVDDGYHFKRYAIERWGSRLLAAGMEWFLRRRPDMPFDHTRNRSRQLLYAIPAFKEWSAFMPGALALEPIHDPEQKHLVSGGKIDPLTRRLFRHGFDPVGIRTRTVVGAWLVRQQLPPSRPEVRWLSLAGGTGVTGLLMLQASGLPKQGWHMHVVDLDTTALDIFRANVQARGLPSDHYQAVHADVLSSQLRRTLQLASYDVLELMGIFEYFNHADSVELLRQAYAFTHPGGVVIFANMRRKHPQLNLHKRGVGWPGVEPRSVDMVAAIVREAGIPLARLEVYQPSDGVYNIYKLTKEA